MALDKEGLIKMRLARKAGYSISEIAKWYNLSETTVKAILHE